MIPQQPEINQQWGQFNNPNVSYNNFLPMGYPLNQTHYSMYPSQVMNPMDVYPMQMMQGMAMQQQPRFQMNQNQNPANFDINQEILSHAFLCDNITCSFPACSTIKLYLFHCAICKTAQCPSCLKVVFWVSKYPQVGSQILNAKNMKVILNPQNIYKTIINYGNPTQMKQGIPMQSDIYEDNKFGEIHYRIQTSNSSIINFLLSPGNVEPNPSDYVYSGPHRYIDCQRVCCTKCGKERKVPSSLPQEIIKNFKCSYNIWDIFHKNCSIEDKSGDEGYRIDLSGNYFYYPKERGIFTECLYQFYRLTSPVLVARTPTLGRKKVDLYRLFREVTAFGGGNYVTSKEGTWSAIYRSLENFSQTETSGSFRIKKIFNKYLSDLEKEFFQAILEDREINMEQPVIEPAKLVKKNELMNRREVWRRERAKKKKKVMKKKRAKKRKRVMTKKMLKLKKKVLKTMNQVNKILICTVKNNYITFLIYY